MQNRLDIFIKFFIQLKIVDFKLMHIKSTVTFLILLASACALELTKISQLDQESFANQTKITFNQQKTQFQYQQDTLIYFYIEGQQTDTQVAKAKHQFEAARNSYLKAIHKNIFEGQLTAVDQDQIIIENIGDIDNKIAEQQRPKQDLNNLHFFIVKCHKNNLNQSSVCSSLGIEDKQKQRIIFFSSSSELIEYKDLITEDKLLFFISKIKQNRRLHNDSIQFDQQLQNIASKFEINVSIKQKAYSLIDQINSYLTWNLLQYLVVFGILPFLFGYLSSKSQQRANKKLIEKYSANTQAIAKGGQKKSKQLENQEKTKSH